MEVRIKLLFDQTYCSSVLVHVEPVSVQGKMSLKYWGGSTIQECKYILPDIYIDVIQCWEPHKTFLCGFRLQFWSLMLNMGENI